MKLRTYVNGDEARLADLFNRCFAGGIIRTETSWKWRFIDNPNFDPEAVIIAEDGGRIKGYIAGVPRRQHLFKGKKIKIVTGDDFCVSPDARGAGLAARLLRGLMTFAEKEDALLLGYVGKGGQGHEVATKLGMSDVYEYLALRRAACTGIVSSTQSGQHWKEPTVRRFSDKDTDRVIDFLNSVNSEKAPAPALDRPEYHWRYLTYQNCSGDSIFLAEERGQIAGHVAISRHPTSTEPFMILSEPCGEIQNIIQSIEEIKGYSTNVVTSPRNLSQYESLGFSLVGRGTVVVSDYTGLDVLQAAKGMEWYLFPESIFGAP
jgi:GNAT superfamily N-acetyltransferase